MQQNTYPNSLGQQVSQSQSFQSEDSTSLCGIKREKFRSDLRRQDVNERLFYKRNMVFNSALQVYTPLKSIHECFDIFMRISDLLTLQEFLNHFQNEESYRQAYQYQLQIRQYLLEPFDTDPEITDRLICWLINTITLTDDKFFTKFDEDDGYRFLFKTFDLINNMNYRICHEGCIILIARMFENNQRLVKVMAANKQKFLSLFSPELQKYNDITIVHFSAICEAMSDEEIKYNLNDEDQYIRMLFSRALEIGDIYTIHGFLYLLWNISIKQRKHIIEDNYEKIFVTLVQLSKGDDLQSWLMIFEILLFCLRNSKFLNVTFQLQQTLMQQLTDFLNRQYDFDVGVECLKVIRYCLKRYWNAYNESMEEQHGSLHQLHFVTSQVGIQWIMKQQKQSQEFIKSFKQIFKVFKNIRYTPNHENQCYMNVIIRMITSDDGQLVQIGLMDIIRVLRLFDQQSQFLRQAIKENYQPMSLVWSHLWEYQDDINEIACELFALIDNHY